MHIVSSSSEEDQMFNRNCRHFGLFCLKHFLVPIALFVSLSRRGLGTRNVFETKFCWRAGQFVALMFSRERNVV